MGVSGSEGVAYYFAAEMKETCPITLKRICCIIDGSLLLFAYGVVCYL